MIFFSGMKVRHTSPTRKQGTPRLRVGLVLSFFVAGVTGGKQAVLQPNSRLKGLRHDQ